MDENKKEYEIPHLPFSFDVETKSVMKQLVSANRRLAELRGVEQKAIETTELVKEISLLMNEYKAKLRSEFGKQYKHELLNNLFNHPYTKIEYVQRDMMVSRQTASKYLDRIVELGLIDKTRIGKENYYINSVLVDLFVNHGHGDEAANPLTR